MEKINQHQAVVAGHICLDITPNFIPGNASNLADILRPGRLTNVSGVALSTGGAVSNTGIALSILGIDTKLMGKIGNDYFGEGILRLVRERNLHDGMTIADGAQTSYTVVIVPPGTDRIFLHDPGANDTFTAEDINYELTGRSRLFHFGYPTLMRAIFMDGCRELIEIYRRVKEQGVTTSLDMSLPDPTAEAGKVDWDAALKKVLPYVDVFVPSLEEILYMVDREEYNRIVAIDGGKDFLNNYDLSSVHKLGDKLLSYGAKVVLIKCGDKGCYLRTSDAGTIKSMGAAAPDNPGDWADRELFEEIFKVPKVVSGTGAGDTCIAGFLAGLLRNFDAGQSLKLACAVGAECVQDYGALGGIKPLEVTYQKVRDGWDKVPTALKTPHWTYDNTARVWIGMNDKTRR